MQLILRVVFECGCLWTTWLTTGVPSPVRLQDLSAAAQAAREALEKAVWRAGNPHESMNEFMGKNAITFFIQCNQHNYTNEEMTLMNG